MFRDVAVSDFYSHAREEREARSSFLTSIIDLWELFFRDDSILESTLLVA